MGVTGFEMFLAVWVCLFFPTVGFGFGFYEGMNKPAECGRYIQNNKQYVKYLEKKIDKMKKDK